MRTRCINHTQKRKTAVKPIDWKIVDRMLRAGCTGVEVAATLGICPNTLYERTEKEHQIEFTAYVSLKRSTGLGLLRETQFNLAVVDKNPTMNIWLGKQSLDQREPESKTVELCRPALMDYLDRLKKPS